MADGQAFFTGSPLQLEPEQNGSFFSHASHAVIEGGEFTINNQIHCVQAGYEHSAHLTSPALNTLMDHVATSAFHNSAGRFDPPRCHENTRKAVLEEIFHWITQDAAREAWIMWLNGAAGAGKSAICQSIAELCIKKKIPVASFFLSLTDPTRNSTWSIAATLAYQLIQLIPAARHLVLHAIDSNPLIFQLTLDTQLEEFIIKPLRRLKLDGHIPNPKYTFLFIIDGVDECIEDANQVAVINSFAKILAEKDLPLIVLFASRTESQLKMAFNALKVTRILYRLPLDNNYFADDDIHVFLTDCFASVKLTHPMHHLLESSWPTAAVVDEIKRKSSGQFIYASVVMKFVSHPRSHPIRQLDIIRGVRPSGRFTPFAELDALYRRIFSAVYDIDLTTKILAYLIIGRGVPDISDIAWFFGLQAEDIYLAFVDLESLIVCKAHQIRFLHASLPDFLVDRQRSCEYFIDVSTWGTKLAIMWLQNIASGELTGWHPRSFLNILKCAEVTTELCEYFATFNPLQIFDVEHRGVYVSAIHNKKSNKEIEITVPESTMLPHHIRRNALKAGEEDEVFAIPIPALSGLPVGEKVAPPIHHVVPQGLHDLHEVSGIQDEDNEEEELSAEENLDGVGGYIMPVFMNKSSNNIE
ncbi:hypothetical protein HYPSUDRAFT_196807 [Hypholoma sublateritium FD-334 SS-4]|uniref:Nephrocystin 3-like N-terminal domain-containing protein n=1 Tax=Hypholoma sublateritium (strain FD-334 SS-4) TaxID=945553 RepID=A0A0D2QCU0_HYPSF|nr:hypothetical protein HYPSUDRAFT_196807 [Hypholoma sublateritium FD-334 SS-4]